MADVILADDKLTPHASVSRVTLDWACGTDENDFELTIDDALAPNISQGWYFWLDGSDVGGRIVDRRVSVAGGTSTTSWIGQSWTGMLAAKILQPDPRQDYLTVSGKLPDILTGLMKRIGLDCVFTVQSDDSSTVTNWRFENPRYVDAYTGFRNLLASCGRRLDFQAKDDHILLGIIPVGIIANTIDSDLVDFRAETNRRAPNHLIGLGSQELKNRLVVDCFADAKGAVSDKQTFSGVDEVCATYDYSNADSATLKSETKKHLQELQTGGSVEVTLSDEVGDGLRVDDKIVATDQASGVNVTAVVYAPAFGFVYNNIDEMARAYYKAPNSVCIEQGVDWREGICRDNKVDGVLVHYNRSCKPWSGYMAEMQRRFTKDLGVPCAGFDGDQADPRNFNEAQYETRVQGLVEAMEANKAEKEGAEK